MKIRRIFIILFLLLIFSNCNTINKLKHFRYIEKKYSIEYSSPYYLLLKKHRKIFTKEEFYRFRERVILINLELNICTKQLIDVYVSDECISKDNYYHELDSLIASKIEKCVMENFKFDVIYEKDSENECDTFQTLFCIIYPKKK